jgi:crotonobetainyl-CoA:carnitine CoA-transferase CaiB-like acyl-CoA transferase
MKDLPLSDLTVLDLSQYVSGPYCTKLLASFGADVIKIESPNGGDISRRYGPFPDDIPDIEKSALFLYLNTNKKSITLDYKTEAGAKILKQLVRQADILVENSSPGVFQYDSFAAENPLAIAASISYFGQDGPYRDFKGADIIAQALGGIMKLTGLSNREPLKIAGPQAEYQAGINAAVAITTAVYFRDMTGQGQRLDISVMECLASILEGALLSYSYDSSLRQRDGARHPTVYPSTIFPCKDGYVHVDASTDWEIFANFMEMPELLQFNPKELRDKADEIDHLISSRLVEYAKDDIFHRAQEWRLPFAKVLKVDELPSESQFIERNSFTEIDHPVAGQQTYAGAPFKMTECEPQNSRAPMLGEHNKEMFCDLLGYTKADLVRLRGMGII